tara:strand:+ start:986 stop:1435 length:450 start_codon:yes stop_codon:yes gene_type:complete
MTFLEELREEIAADEGVKHEIYLDHLGFKTCGIGHLCLGHELEYNLPVGTRITEERVAELFDQDIKRTLSDCQVIHPEYDDYPAEAQKVIASMCYQMGMPRLMKFRKTNDLIKKRMWREASIEMLNSRWHEQTPQRAKRLSQRMAAIAD